MNKLIKAVETAQTAADAHLLDAIAVWNQTQKTNTEHIITLMMALDLSITKEEPFFSELLTHFSDQALTHVFSLCCEHGNERLAEQLWTDASRRIDLSMMRNGHTPFVWACMQGHVNIVNWLKSKVSIADLDQGAEVAGKKSHEEMLSSIIKQTAQHFACPPLEMGEIEEHDIVDASCQTQEAREAAIKGDYKKLSHNIALSAGSIDIALVIEAILKRMLTIEQLKVHEANLEAIYEKILVANLLTPKSQLQLNPIFDQLIQGKRDQLPIIKKYFLNGQSFIKQYKNLLYCLQLASASYFIFNGDCNVFRSFFCSVPYYFLNYISMLESDNLMWMGMVTHTKNLPEIILQNFLHFKSRKLADSIISKIFFEEHELYDLIQLSYDYDLNENILLYTGIAERAVDILPYFEDGDVSSDKILLLIRVARVHFLLMKMGIVTYGTWEILKDALLDRLTDQNAFNDVLRNWCDETRNQLLELPDLHELNIMVDTITAATFNLPSLEDNLPWRNFAKCYNNFFRLAARNHNLPVMLTTRSHARFFINVIKTEICKEKSNNPLVLKTILDCLDSDFLNALFYTAHQRSELDLVLVLLKTGRIDTELNYANFPFGFNLLLPDDYRFTFPEAEVSIPKEKPIIVLALEKAVSSLESGSPSVFPLHMFSQLFEKSEEDMYETLMKLYRLSFFEMVCLAGDVRKVSDYLADNLSDLSDESRIIIHHGLILATAAGHQSVVELFASSLSESDFLNLAYSSGKQDEIRWYTELNIIADDKDTSPVNIAKYKKISNLYHLFNIAEETHANVNFGVGLSYEKLLMSLVFGGEGLPERESLPEEARIIRLMTTATNIGNVFPLKQMLELDASNDIKAVHIRTAFNSYTLRNFLLEAKLLPGIFHYSNDVYERSALLLFSYVVGARNPIILSLLLEKITQLQQEKIKLRDEEVNDLLEIYERTVFEDPQDNAIKQAKRIFKRRCLNLLEPKIFATNLSECLGFLLVQDIESILNSLVMTKLKPMLVISRNARIIAQSRAFSFSGNLSPGNLSSRTRSYQTWLQQNRVLVLSGQFEDQFCTGYLKMGEDISQLKNAIACLKIFLRSGARLTESDIRKLSEINSSRLYYISAECAELFVNLQQTILFFSQYSIEESIPFSLSVTNLMVSQQPSLFLQPTSLSDAFNLAVKYGSTIDIIFATELYQQVEKALLLICFNNWFVEHVTFASGLQIDSQIFRRHLFPYVGQEESDFICSAMDQLRKNVIPVVISALFYLYQANSLLPKDGLYSIDLFSLVSSLESEPSLKKVEEVLQRVIQLLERNKIQAKEHEILSKLKTHLIQQLACFPEFGLAQQSLRIQTSGEEESINMIVKPVPGDGECGFTAIGIARGDAYHRLLDNLEDPRVRELLLPALQDLLQLANSPDERDQMVFREFQALLQNEGINEIDQSNVELLINILTIYLDFDVNKKEIEAGYTHPAILQALAHVSGINLYIWRRDDTRYVPHRIPGHYDYARYVASPDAPVVDILFSNSNHYDRLERLARVEEVVEQDISNSDIVVEANSDVLMSDGTSEEVILSRNQQSFYGGMRREREVLLNEDESENDMKEPAQKRRKT